MIKTNKYDAFSVQKTKASGRSPLLYEYCAVFVCSRHFYNHREAIPSLCTLHSALCTNNSSSNQNLKIDPATINCQSLSISPVFGHLIIAALWKLTESSIAF